MDELAWVLRKFGSIESITEICQSILNSKIRFMDVNKSIIHLSLEIIKEFNLKPRDAIHVATMKAHNIKSMISEDPGFDKVDWIKRKSIIDFKI